MPLNKNLSIAVLVSVVLAAIFLIFGIPSNWNIAGFDSNQETKANRTPEYKIINFSNAKFDQNGALNYELNAGKLVHFQKPAYSELSQAQINYYLKDNEGSSQPVNQDQDQKQEMLQPAWRITSDFAQSANPEEKIRLNGNVILLHYAKDSREVDLEIKSNSMELLVANRQVSSPDLVQITSQRGVINGQGFHADLNENSLRLKKNVSSTYE